MNNSNKLLKKLKVPTPNVSFVKIAIDKAESPRSAIFVNERRIYWCAGLIDVEPIERLLKVLDIEHTIEIYE